MARKKINVSTVLAGQRLGTIEVDDGIRLVSFLNYDLGYIDLEQRPCRPSTTRSARGCVTLVLGTNCYVSGAYPKCIWRCWQSAANLSQGRVPPGSPIAL